MIKFHARDRRLVGLVVSSGWLLGISTLGTSLDITASPSDPIPHINSAIYSSNCAECHGADGRARTAKGRRTGATDLTSDWNSDEARALRIIRNGKGDMPAFKGKLTAAQMREVYAYVVKFKR